MVRTRHGWLVAALALGLSFGACKKDDKAAAGGSGTTAAGGGGTAEKPAGNADDLSLLPVDSELVGGLNFAQLQTSALWKKFVEPQMMKGDFQQHMAEFKDKCGFDPLAAVKTISVGAKGLGDPKPNAVIVVHGPDKDKSLACLDKMKDEAAKDGSTIARDGDVTTITSKHGDAFAFTFVNSDTVVAVIGPNANTAGVKAAAAGGSTLKTSPAFVEMYGKINTGDSMWGLINGNSKAFDQAAALGFKPKAVFGSLNVTDGLTMDVHVRLDTPDQATQIANMVKGQTAQFVKMVDKLDVTTEASDMKVSIAISQQKLEQLVQQLSALMMGGMGGPPGGGMGGPGGPPQSGTP